jgi:hypothetical protein
LTSSKYKPSFITSVVFVKSSSGWESIMMYGLYSFHGFDISHCLPSSRCCTHKQRPPTRDAPRTEYGAASSCFSARLCSKKSTRLRNNHTVHYCIFAICAGCNHDENHCRVDSLLPPFLWLVCHSRPLKPSTKGQ